MVHVDFKLPGHMMKKQAHCPTHGEYTGVFYRESGKQIGTCQQCQHLLDVSDINKNSTLHLFNIADIPSRYQSKGLRDYVTNNESQSNAVRVAKSYLENYSANPSRCLILTGKAGTGKTHLSIGIMRNLINRGLHCKYTTLNDMFAKIKETYGGASVKTEDEVIASYVRPALLVLDEVGMSHLTKTEDSLLYRIINGRYVEGRATVITSNLLVSELKSVVGERIIDRLREGDGWLIELQHESYRDGRG